MLDTLMSPHLESDPTTKGFPLLPLAPPVSTFFEACLASEAPLVPEKEDLFTFGDDWFTPPTPSIIVPAALPASECLAISAFSCKYLLARASVSDMEVPPALALTLPAA